MNKKWYDNPLACFIGGMLFYVAAPMLESISAFGQSAINKVINKWQCDVALDQAEAQAAAEVIAPATGGNTQAIGFETQSSCGCEEEEW